MEFIRTMFPVHYCFVVSNVRTEQMFIDVRKETAISYNVK